jgi:filamin
MIDSPFCIRVGSRNDADPTAIQATGNGLKFGNTGNNCEFIINTCNAGAGHLAITVDGPSKVTLDAHEVGRILSIDTFLFSD